MRHVIGSVLCDVAQGDSSHWVGSDSGTFSSGTFLWHLAVEITARGNNNNKSPLRRKRAYTPDAPVTRLPAHLLQTEGLQARGVKKLCAALSRLFGTVGLKLFNKLHDLQTQKKRHTRYARCRGLLCEELALLCMREDICLQLNIMPHRAALGLDAAFPEYIYYSDNSSDSDTRLATVRFTGTSHGPGRCALPLSKKARSSSSDQHDISGSSSRSSAKHLVGGGG